MNTTKITLSDLDFASLGAGEVGYVRKMKSDELTRRFPALLFPVVCVDEPVNPLQSMQELFRRIRQGIVSLRRTCKQRVTKWRTVGRKRNHSTCSPSA